jgi:hypothetical protein
VVALLGLANRRFGVLGGGLAGGPDAGVAYSWLDAHLSAGSEVAVSAMVYLLMGSAVAVAFAGARLLRGRRAPLTGELIDWRPGRPTRAHIFGSVAFGIGWALSARPKVPATEVL